MAKSYKLEDGNYIDSTSIVHNKTKLSDILTYSTTEKIVGTWIDGKPIYEKVLVNSSLTGGDYEILPFSHNNLGEILDTYGFATSGNGNWFPLSRAHHQQFKYQISYYYAYLSDEFQVEIGTDVSLNKIYIIVRYTKTTD